MYISKAKKILFVHIQKTGGSSVREALQRRIPDLQPYLGTHDHAVQARKDLGESWSDYYKVAFVRNPWDRLVSWYMMIKQQGRITPWYRRWLENDQKNRLWHYVLKNARSFEEFVYNCDKVIVDKDGTKSIWYNQVDYICDETGQEIVDFVGRYETLEHDAAVLFERLGLVGLELPHLNRSRHEHYSTYYDKGTESWVTERYSRDIRHFGYEFVRAATAAF